MMPLVFGSKEANEQLARDTGKRLSTISVWTDDALAALAMEDDSQEAYCSICGGYMDFIDCWQCHGAGEFDLYDEDPIYYDEGDTEPCDVCRGVGGYWKCASLPHDDAAGESHPIAPPSIP